MARGIDTASMISTTLAAYLKANGYTFVVRYFDDSFGRSSKALKKEEIAVIQDANLGIIPVFETTGATGVDDTPRGADYLTMNQGMYDAQHASAEAEQLGYPVGYPIAFAVDTDLLGDDLRSLKQYTQGLKDILVDRHPIWIYGPWDVLQFCRDFCQNEVKGFYQAYAPAWSQGRNANPFPDADIRQILNSQNMAGTAVDIDEAKWEGWSGTMTISDEEVNRIADAVYNRLAPDILTKIDSGFNTTIVAEIRRAMRGHDPNVPGNDAPIAVDDALYPTKAP